MNGSDGMFKYEEIVLERVSLPVGQDARERGGFRPGNRRALSLSFRTHGGGLALRGWGNSGPQKLHTASINQTTNEY